MFSHNSGRKPTLRTGALKLVFSLMACAVIPALAQELNAPLQAPSGNQQPGQFRQPGPMQRPGAIQQPGAFQNPGMIQSPGGYQNLPAPPEPQEPGSPMTSAGMPAAPSLIHRIQAAIGTDGNDREFQPNSHTRSKNSAGHRSTTKTSWN